MDYVFILTTREAVTKFAKDGLASLGISADLAIGIGRTAEAGVTTDFKDGLQPIYTYASSKGIYGGVTAELGGSEFPSFSYSFSFSFSKPSPSLSYSLSLFSPNIYYTVKARNDVNDKIYGQRVAPEVILSESNPLGQPVAAAPLYEALERLYKSFDSTMNSTYAMEAASVKEGVPLEQRESYGFGELNGKGPSSSSSSSAAAAAAASKVGSEPRSAAAAGAPPPPPRRSSKDPWEKVKTENGEVYWWNTDTDETTWDDPHA